MKQLLLLFALLLGMAACGGNDEPKADASDTQAVNELATLLNGKFIGSQFSQATNTTETYEITFTPYSTPKSEQWSNGSVTNTVLLHGNCRVSHYFNNHQLEVTKDWRYSINVAYSGAQPKLYYYPTEYGQTEMHYITKKSATSFELDGITFNKQ